MDSKELRELMEAYTQVYAPQEEIEEAVKGADPEMRKAASAERRAGDRPLSKKVGDAHAANMARKIRFSDKVTKAKGHIPGYAYAEELDIFDVVLEFLQAEGYAETLEEAEWMMANVIDEEAIDIITELSVNKMLAYGKAAKKDRDVLNKKWDEKKASHKEKMRVLGHEEGEERAAQKIKKKTGKYPHQMNALDKARYSVTKEDYVDEAQHARENPEKYEREQAKKSAPVRGERTPMPPRGDKRREDFEKWYAANVR